MIVDDRLETVLRTAAAGTGAIRTQLRQLADILGRTPAESWTGSHLAALDRIDSHLAALGDAPSGALLRTATLDSPILVEHFAGRGPKVALAAIMAARLPEADWMRLIPELPVQARGFLRHRRDLGPAVGALLGRLGVTDFALPLPEGFEPMVLGTDIPVAALPVEEQPVPAQIPTPLPAHSSAASQDEGIGAIIQRIEAFRRTRDAQTTAAAPAMVPPGTGAGQSRLPFADEPLPAVRAVTAIDIRLDANGTIIAADAPHAAALIGLRPFVADPDGLASCDAASQRAARAHQPIEAGLCLIETGEPLGGHWRMDAAPLFAAETGHFLGYGARLRRPAPATGAALAAAANGDAKAAASADRLRQMLHELRTPINAIQGFSELIQQQMLGPTPHQYRSLAAGIASDAARMLAGFEDIERLVALESGRIEPAEDDNGGETDLAALLARLIGQLDPVLAPREVRLRCDLLAGPLRVAAAPIELERALWRLLSLIAGAAAPGERLSLVLEADEGQARLALPLPAALALRDDTALMVPDPATAMAGAGAAMLGGGFALRLAGAEIRALGGALSRHGARLDVLLPLLTGAHQTLSHNTRPAGQAG